MILDPAERLALGGTDRERLVVIDEDLLDQPRPRDEVDRLSRDFETNDVSERRPLLDRSNRISGERESVPEERDSCKSRTPWIKTR